MPEPQEGGQVPELVTFTEIAKRVTARGLVSRPITRQGVRHIADTDPAWPIPADQWLKIGNAWAMPWKPVEEFFSNRHVRGRGRAKSPRRRPKEEGT